MLPDILLYLTIVYTVVAIAQSTSMLSIEKYRFPRSLIPAGEQNSDLILGAHDEHDKLLLEKDIVRQNRFGGVVYDDLIFSEQSYEGDLIYDCPYNITAVSVEHQGLKETAGQPLILYGGIGAAEILILFISQRGENLNFTVKIWGREFGNKLKHFNLLEGEPVITDDLLLFTTVSQSGQNEPVTGSVNYNKPENKNVTISSVQAWDVSSGCKLGGYPTITEGGIGDDKVTVQISSEKFKGFKYHVLVFGDIVN